MPRRDSEGELEANELRIAESKQKQKDKEDDKNAKLAEKLG